MSSGEESFDDDAAFINDASEDEESYSFDSDESEESDEQPPDLDIDSEISPEEEEYMLDKDDTITFCDKLNELRISKKYHDVTIQVEERTFDCHKIILASSSEYFDMMLGGDFQESKTNKITLNTLSAETFGEILSFMYSRQVRINYKNVINLLLASNFFGMPYLEELCFKYVERHHRNLPCENVLEVFQFAVNINKCDPDLLDDLCQNLISRFSAFSRCSLFTDMSYPALNLVLQWIDFECNGDAIVEAILRWINFKVDDRKGVLPEIIEMIEFRSTNARYLKRLLKFAAGCKKTEVPSSSKLVCCDEKDSRNMSLQVYFRCNSSTTPYLGAFALDYKKSEWKCNSKRRTIEYDDGNKTKSYSVEATFHSTRTVSGDHLYHFFCNSSDTSIFACSSLTNTHRQIRLRNPPIRGFDTELCSDQDRVYLYYRGFDQTSYDAHNNIFVYQTEPNKWSDLPYPPIKPGNSVLIPCNNIVYMLGMCYGDHRPMMNGVCRFDGLSPRWQVLPRIPSMPDSSKNLAVCEFNEKLYATYGSSSSVVVFDPVANKWEFIAPKMKTYKTYNEFKIVTYNDLIWVFGKTIQDEIYGVEVYNPKTNRWSNFNSPDAVLGLQNDDRHKHYRLFDVINIHSASK